MAGTLSPSPWLTFDDANGNPYVGAKLFTYLSGTATKTTTYLDAALGSSNTNPIILDSAGRATIYLVPGVAYKYVLAPSTDSDPPVAPIKTTDPVNTVPAITSNVDITGIAGEALTALQTVYLSDGSGAKTAGKWYLTDSANTYSSDAANQVGFVLNDTLANASTTIRTDGLLTSSFLTPGAIYYFGTGAGAGGITTTAPTNARAFGFGNSAGDLVLFGPNPLLRGQPLFDKTPLYKPGTATAYDCVTNGTLLASVDTAQRANGTTIETTLSSFSLTASTLGSNPKGIKVSAGGTYAANANTKTLKFYFGATSVTLYTGAQNGGSWNFYAYVIRTGAATQKIVGLYSGVAAAGTVVNTTVSTTAAETLSGAITVKTTGQSGTAGSDVLQEVFIPETIGA